MHGESARMPASVTFSAPDRLSDVNVSLDEDGCWAAIVAKHSSVTTMLHVDRSIELDNV